jgi:hypothetical protein
MNRYHTVHSLTFDGQWMILSVDEQTYRIPVPKTSQRLASASESDRLIYQVAPSGYGIHWPTLDEDLSIDGLIRVAQRSPSEPVNS